jgi:fluoride ion exporter CrcB/FEX
MIGYFWIGIGGAVGSIGRAWLALARITGPQFPWGTIFINIVGSFVIGFFGTLTTSGSRLLAHDHDAARFASWDSSGSYELAQAGNTAII